MSRSFGHTIKVWDIKSGKSVRTLADDDQAIISVAYCSDGTKLASGSDDKTVKIWYTEDWHLQQNLTGGTECVYSVAFSPNRKYLLSGSRDGGPIGEFIQNFFNHTGMNKVTTIRFWDVENGKLLDMFSENANDVNAVAFSNDGKRMAIGSDDSKVVVWRLLK